MSFLIADSRNPYMGLNNKVCENPKYWCRLHQIWLSENDVKSKNCRSKLTFDMMSTYQCGNLERKEVKIHNE